MSTNFRRKKIRHGFYCLYTGVKTLAFRQWWFSYNQPHIKSDFESNIDEIKEIDKKKKEIERALTASYIDKTKGIIEEKDFIIMKKIFDEDIEKLISRKNRLEAKAKADNMKNSLIKDHSSLIKKYVSFDILTNEIVNDFVDSVYVWKDEIIINWLF